MKKTLRILLGVLILTMLSTTPVFAGWYYEGINGTTVNGEYKKFLANEYGDIIEAPAGTWYMYDGSWYYFVEDNYVAWGERLCINGKNYFFNTNGVMCTGVFSGYEKNSNLEKKMVTDENGVLYEPGWHKNVYPYDATYYIYEDYTAAYGGLKEIDGKKYNFNSYCRLSPGHLNFTLADGTKVYTVTDETGALVELKNSWYYCKDKETGLECTHYFGENGYFCTDGIYKIDGKKYKFNHAGTLIGEADGTEELRGWFEHYDENGYGGWYYRKQDGELLKDGIYEVDGKKYYFEKSGRMKSGLVVIIDATADKVTFMLTDKNGALYEKVGWFTVDGKTYYFLEDHTLVADQIYLIDNKYYYFDPNGERQTGWIEYKGEDYWFTEDGSARSGWIYENKAWYYYNKDGSRYKGWITLNGVTYYLDKYNGAMAVGFTEIDGVRYYFNQSGAMQKACWTQINGAWYYFNADGSLHTGWLQLGNTRYYMDENGVMKTGSFRAIDEKSRVEQVYIANDSGAIVTKQGWVKIAPKEGDIDWYYVLADGTVANSRAYTIDGKVYSLTDLGKVRKNLFGGAEWLDYGKWYQQGNEWYYINEIGQFANGLQTIDGKKYYFENRVMQKGIIQFLTSNTTEATYLTDESGAIITKEGFHKYNGNYYYVRSDGQLINGVASDADIQLKHDSRVYAFKHYGDNIIVLTQNSVLLGTHKPSYWIKGKVILTEPTSSTRYYYLIDDNGYVHPDHVGWYKLESGWVYFSEKYEAVYGLQRIDGAEYYFDGTYTMVSNGIADTGVEKYYADASGKLVKNRWIQYDGYWYYATSDCTLARNEWCTIDGKRYYFNEYARMVTSDIQVDGVWYKFNRNGEYIGQKTSFTGWKKVNNEWYFNDSSGKAYTGWLESTYYIQDGKMLYNKYAEVNGYKGQSKYDGYYFGDDGRVVTNGWVRIKNNRLYEEWGRNVGDYIWYYIGTNGDPITSSWKYSGNKWYYFDIVGQMVTGTVIIGNEFHKFDSSGAWIGQVSGTGNSIYSKWVKVNGDWFYYNQDGNLTTGRYTIGGTTYYFDEDGIMITDQIVWSNYAKEYVYVNKDGAESTLPNGWNKVSGNKWCYVAKGYEILNGFQTIGGIQYYFEDGYMQVGWHTNKREGKEIFFGKDGARVIPKDGWYYDGEHWYYWKNGAPLTGSQTIGGKTYYFDISGEMHTGRYNGDKIYGKDGALLKNQWIQLNTQYMGLGGNSLVWCYANAYGDAVTGTHVIDGVTYYFDENGVMLQ